MGRVILYKQDQLASALVGVPQTDNSGAILSNAIASSTGTIADAQTSASQSAMYHSRQALTNMLSDVGSLIRRKQVEHDAVVKEQNRIFQADADNEVLTQFETETNQQSQDAKNDPKYAGKPLDRAPAFGANQDQAIEDHLDSAGIQDPVRRSALRPKMRNMYGSETRSLSAYDAGIATRDAPDKWVLDAKGLSRSMTTLNDAKWGTPEDRAANQGFLVKQATALMNMKPGYAMTPTQTRELQTKELTNMLTQYGDVVAQKDPDFFDAAMKQTVSGEGSDSVTVGGMMDESQFTRLTAKRDRAWAYNDDQAKKTFEWADKNNHTIENLHRADVDPKNQASVSEYNNLVDATKLETSNTIKALQATREKTTDAKTLKDLDGNIDTWNKRLARLIEDQKEGSSMQKALDADAKERAGEISKAEVDAKKAAQDNAYNAGSGHRVLTEQLMQNLSRADFTAIMNGTKRLSAEEKKAYEPIIGKLNDLFREGMKKGYYAKDGVMPDGIKNDMALTSNMQWAVSAPDKELGFPAKYVKEFVDRFKNYTNPPQDRFTPGARSFDLYATYTADPTFHNTAVQNVNAVNEQLKKQGAQPLTQIEVDKSVATDQAASIRRNYEQAMNKFEGGRIPAPPVNTTATKAMPAAKGSSKGYTSGKKGTKSTGSGLVPPPPPMTEGVPVVDAATWERFQRWQANGER